MDPRYKKIQTPRVTQTRSNIPLFPFTEPMHKMHGIRLTKHTMLGAPTCSNAPPALHPTTVLILLSVFCNLVAHDLDAVFNVLGRRQARQEQFLGRGKMLPVSGATLPRIQEALGIHSIVLANGVLWCSLNYDYHILNMTITHCSIVQSLQKHSWIPISSTAATRSDGFRFANMQKLLVRYLIMLCVHNINNNHGGDCYFIDHNTWMIHWFTKKSICNPNPKLFSSSMYMPST